MDTSGTMASTYAPQAPTPAGTQLRLLVGARDNKDVTRYRLDVEVRRAQVRAKATSSS